MYKSFYKFILNALLFLYKILRIDFYDILFLKINIRVKLVNHTKRRSFLSSTRWIKYETLMGIGIVILILSYTIKHNEWNEIWNDYSHSDFINVCILNGLNFSLQPKGRDSSKEKPDRASFLSLSLSLLLGRWG